MTRILPFGMVVWAAVGGGVALPGQPPVRVDYDRDIRPILAEHCLECHSLDKAKGGLSLASRNEAMKTLKSGFQGLVSGSPESSEIFRRVTTSDADDRMPPEGREPLKKVQVEKLRQWIAEGADWPVHWAYRPLAESSAPPVKETSWPKGELDRFVLAKLEAAGLTPSPEASRTTLIRRVHYDLLGLPPSPREIQTYLEDAEPDAYEKMVDRALASEHFGERWGRHWLDMARYADSDGYEKDRARPDAWRYRDWVIRAINADMPFDQFTVEQLAGDLLPNVTVEQVVATAFHRQTLTNTEGGADQEQFRVEAVFDRTETTGAVWLGLSVGCARCHSHKYDQISHEEYFRLFAFFNNGEEVTRRVPVSPGAWVAYEKQHGGVAAKLDGLQKQVEEARLSARRNLPAWEKEVQARLAEARRTGRAAVFEPLKLAAIESSDSQTAFTRLGDESWLASGGRGQNETYTLTVDENSSGQSLVALQLEALPDRSLPGGGPGRSERGNFVLNEITLKAGRPGEEGCLARFHSVKGTHEQKGYASAGAADGDASTGWAVQPQTGRAHSLTLQLETPLALAPGERMVVELHHAYKGGRHNLGRFRLLGSRVLTEESIAPAAVLRVLNEEPLRRNDVVIQPLFDWVEGRDAGVRAAVRELEEARRGLPQPPLMEVRVISQRRESPRVTHRLHRGDFLSPAEPVEAGGLAVLPPMRAAQPHAADRLDLARWLVDPANPLTPRVAVNHIWTRLFGEGLVRTVDDFGVRGEPPSHPELLDWLAREHVQKGWHRKVLLKTVLMSATYRQSSVHRPGVEEVDPLNRMLHRQNRVRVEAEIVRDLHLAAAGLLSRKIGGPSVFPALPADVAALSYANNFKWNPSTGEDKYRRGMYTFFKRTAPHPDLTTFDCPDANTANLKRTLSNTPLQALATLNAATFAEAAKGLAGRVLRDRPGASDEGGIGHLFLLCVARPPSERELKAMAALLADARSWYEASPQEAAVYMKGFEVPSVTLPEAAAWAAAARVVLNLDEFITRE